MSFNVRSGIDGDGGNAWALRCELNLAVVRRNAPDIVGFQEHQEHHWRFHRRALPEYEACRGPAYTNHNEWLPIFWRAERFELIDQDGFYLSETPDMFSLGWGGQFVRAANWVRLADCCGGGRIVVLNTHLDPYVETARTKAAELIVDRLQTLVQPGEGCIAMGDFNCEPGTSAYASFIRAGFADAWLASGQADGLDAFTFHTFTGRRQADLGRIDWIMVKPPLRVNTCRIVRDDDPPRYPSDHFPIYADVA